MTFDFQNILRDEIGSGIDAETVVLVMLMAFCLGQVISWIYMRTHTGLSYSQAFTTSLVIMTMLVSMVMMLMSGNIYIAFGLMAVVAVVRFRNAMKDTRDTAFILWAIIQGMSVGTMKFTVAWVGCALMSAVIVYLWLTSFGSKQRFDVVLSLHLAGAPTDAALLIPLLRRHSSRIQLASQRSLTEEMMDLSYRLSLRDPGRSGELLEELEATEGVAHVSLYQREDESEL